MTDVWARSCATSGVCTPAHRVDPAARAVTALGSRGLLASLRGVGGTRSLLAKVSKFVAAFGARGVRNRVVCLKPKKSYGRATGQPQTPNPKRHPRCAAKGEPPLLLFLPSVQPPSALSVCAVRQTASHSTSSCLFAFRHRLGSLCGGPL